MAELVLDRHHGQAVNRRRIDVLPYIIGSYLRHCLGYVLLFLLHEGAFFDLLAPFLTKLIHRLPEIGRHSIVSAKGGAHLVHLLGQLGLHIVLVDGERVDAGLHQEEFAAHHILKELAADVTVRGIAAGAHHLHLLLYFRKGDKLAAHHGDGLIDNVLILLRRRREAAPQQRERYNCSFEFHTPGMVCKACSKIIPRPWRRDASPKPMRRQGSPQRCGWPSSRAFPGQAKGRPILQSRRRDAWELCGS